MSDNLHTATVKLYEAEDRKTRKRDKTRKILVAAVLLTGLGVAVSACGGAAATPQPVPTVTVTETAEPEVRVEKEEVFVTPDACLAYMDLAEAARSASVMMVSAMYEGTVSLEELEEMSAAVEEANEQLADLRADCEAGVPSGS